MSTFGLIALRRLRHLTAACSLLLIAAYLAAVFSAVTPSTPGVHGGAGVAATEHDPRAVTAESPWSGSIGPSARAAPSLPKYPPGDDPTAAAPPPALPPTVVIKGTASPALAGVAVARPSFRPHPTGPPAA